MPGARQWRNDEAATPGASANHSRDGAGKQLAVLKKSLAVYRDVEAAEAAGFIPVSECEVSDEGGMGVHYLNPVRAAQARRKWSLVMGVLDGVGWQLELPFSPHRCADARRFLPDRP